MSLGLRAPIAPELSRIALEIQTNVSNLLGYNMLSFSEEPSSIPRHVAPVLYSSSSVLSRSLSSSSGSPSPSIAPIFPSSRNASSAALAAASAAAASPSPSPPPSASAAASLASASAAVSEASSSSIYAAASVEASRFRFKNMDKHIHIIDALQNLILAYSDKYEYQQWDDESLSEELTSAMAIAQISGSLYYQTTGRFINTQSDIWCPLIFNALSLGGVYIPIYMKQPPSGFDAANFRKLSLALSKISGWVTYTLYILEEYNINKSLPNQFNKTIFDEMRDIIDTLGLDL